MRVRRARLLPIPLLALLASLVVPSLHVRASHVLAASGPSAAQISATAGSAHGAGSSSDADHGSCSLCRAANLARSLLAASDCLRADLLPGAVRSLHLARSAAPPVELTLAAAAPRAPPSPLFQA
jgi:hypothetical protein